MKHGNTRRTLTALAAVVFLCPGARAEDDPQLSVIFAERAIELSGVIDSEETGQRLARTVKSVRPDLAILNTGLRIEPAAAMPNESVLADLLSEIGLSTYEGRLQIWKDRVLIGGLTDSLVTQTALRIRAEPLLEGRRLVNHICIVSTDDLPAPNVTLSSNESGLLLDFEPNPSAQEVYEPPGIPLTKLYPTVLMLSDFSRLTGDPADAIRAIPVSAEPAVSGPETGSTAAMSPAAELLAPDEGAAGGDPVDAGPQYVAMDSIRFSRNTFALQANQGHILENVVKQLQDPNFQGLPIHVEPVKPAGGSSAYNDYLCERRSDALKRMLVERGVSAERISISPVPASSPMDDGEVRIRVELPPPPPPESVEPATGDTAPATVATESPVQ